MINNIEGMSAKELREVVKIQMEEFSKLLDSVGRKDLIISCANKAINQVDDLFEYHYKMINREQVKNRVDKILDDYVVSLADKLGKQEVV